MKTWFFFMALLLAPFWTFGKEKSTDQTETEKDEWIVPEVPFPTCYFFSELDPDVPIIAFGRPCETLVNTPSEERTITILPLNYGNLFYLPDEFQQKNDVIADDEFINYLDQLGVLSHDKVEINKLCLF